MLKEIYIKLYKLELRCNNETYAKRWGWNY